jgi:hypothetical protein
MLVVSDEVGEGSLVSEVAVRRPAPWATVARGSKLLADQDWVGHNFQMRYSSSSALMRELEDLHVRYLIVDCSPKVAALIPYLGQVNELIETNGNRLDRIYASTQGRPLTVYQLKYQSPGPAQTEGSKELTGCLRSQFAVGGRLGQHAPKARSEGNRSVRTRGRVEAAHVS